MTDTRTRDEIAWEVGNSKAICVVGIEGEITALDPDAGTMTIAGHTVPTRLGNGVRYLSMLPPDVPDPDPCNRDHCDDACADGKVVERERDTELYAAVRDHHNALHRDTIGRFCSDPLCKALPVGEW